MPRDHSTPTISSLAQGARASWYALSLMLLASTSCSRLLSDPVRFGEVDVTVSRRNGTPVAGALLTLFTGQRPVQYARSGADGRYRFVDVPFGFYGVSIFAPEGYLLPEAVIGGPSTSVAGGITVDGGAIPPVKFQLLAEGTGAVFVLASAPDGTPVANVETSLFDSRAVRQRGVTGADGRFTFGNVPLGVYGVNFKRPSGYRDLGEEAFLSVDTRIVENGTLDTIKVTLARCQGTVQTRVTDEGGRPVGGIGVRLYGGAGVNVDTVTASDGVATFARADCGEYGVLLAPLFGYAVSLARGVGFQDGIRVTRATPSATVQLRPRTDSCGSSIRARVVDAAGAPIADAAVFLYTGAGSSQNAKSGTDGVATFARLPCSAEYGVRVVPPAGYSVTAGRGSSFYDAVKPSASSEVIFTLARG